MKLEDTESRGSFVGVNLQIPTDVKKMDIYKPTKTPTEFTTVCRLSKFHKNRFLISNTYNTYRKFKIVEK